MSPIVSLYLLGCTCDFGLEQGAEGDQGWPPGSD